MKRSIVLGSTLLFLYAVAIAQDGYKLSLKLVNATPGKITLSIYRGSPAFTFVIDSANITKAEQTIVFSNNKKILGGIYKLQVNGDKQNSRDIVLDNGAVVNCILDKNNLESLTTANNINKQFFKLSETGITEDERTGILQTMLRTFPTSIVGLYANIELKKTEADQANGDTEKGEVKKTYLKGIDLNDKRIQLLPNIYSYLFLYTKLTNINNENYQQSVDAILKGMKCTDRNHMFYLDWIFKNIKYYEAINLNESYRYVYNNYLNKEGCNTIDKKFYDRITADLSTLSDLRNGTILPDFEMQDSLGTTYKDKELIAKTKFSFFAFYDPDCEHCKLTMPKVSEFFRMKNYPSNLVQLIAFRNTREPKDWDAFINKSNLQHWMNVKPNKDDQTYLTKLKVYSNPTFILVDNTGKIRLLKFNETDLANILEHK